MTQQEYETYLRRLIHLIYVELVVKLATLDYFWVHAYRFPQKPEQVEPLLWPITSGLYCDVTFSLHRLVYAGNSDRNIIHFLNVSNQEFKRLQWRGTITKHGIELLREAWQGKSEVIGRLTTRRNKFFAHYDKEHFYDPDDTLASIPFDIEDAKDLTRLLQHTASFFSEAMFGSMPVSMEGFVYAAAERLYETLRKAAPSAD